MTARVQWRLYADGTPYELTDKEIQERHGISSGVEFLSLMNNTCRRRGWKRSSRRLEHSIQFRIWLGGHENCTHPLTASPVRKCLDKRRAKTRTGRTRVRRSLNPVGTEATPLKDAEASAFLSETAKKRAEAKRRAKKAAEERAAADLQDALAKKRARVEALAKAVAPRHANCDHGPSRAERAMCTRRKNKARPAATAAEEAAEKKRVAEEKARRRAARKAAFEKAAAEVAEKKAAAERARAKAFAGQRAARKAPWQQTSQWERFADGETYELTAAEIQDLYGITTEQFRFRLRGYASRQLLRLKSELTEDGVRIRMRTKYREDGRPTTRRKSRVVPVVTVTVVPQPVTPTETVEPVKEAATVAAPKPRPSYLKSRWAMYADGREHTVTGAQARDLHGMSVSQLRTHLQVYASEHGLRHSLRMIPGALVFRISPLR
ncbi:hypothetical protein [Streptomyces wuyuanensis]|uniref:hypothetical protein n=1 Tax=Streptomyces wuyuanensis TaxID=1196353 RepID=UPI003436F952